MRAASDTGALVNETQGCLFQLAAPAGTECPAPCALGVALHLLAGEWSGNAMSVREAGTQHPLLTDITHLVDAGRDAALRPVAGFTGRVPRVLLNLDRRERLDPPALGDRSSLRGLVMGEAEQGPGGVHGALRMLLAAPGTAWTTRGGTEVAGSWSGCRIAVLPVTAPESRAISRSVADAVRESLAAAHIATYRFTAQGVVRTSGNAR